VNAIRYENRVEVLRKEADKKTRLEKRRGEGMLVVKRVYEGSSQCDKGLTLNSGWPEGGGELREENHAVAVGEELGKKTLETKQEGECASRRPPPVCLRLPSSSFGDPQTGAPDSAMLDACSPRQRVCVFRWTRLLLPVTVNASCQRESESHTQTHDRRSRVVVNWEKITTRWPFAKSLASKRCNRNGKGSVR